MSTEAQRDMIIKLAVLHAAQSELKSVIDLFQAPPPRRLLAAALRAATDRLRKRVATREGGAS